MRIFLKQDDFAVNTYELYVDDSTLKFAGERNPFAVPLTEIQDFYITQRGNGSAYFNLFAAGQMLEGRLLETEVGKAEPFLTELKKKINGTINIELLRN